MIPTSQYLSYGHDCELKLTTYPRSTFKAAHGSQIGWKTEYPPEHILEVADAEVELILKTLNKK